MVKGNTACCFYSGLFCFVLFSAASTGYFSHVTTINLHQPGTIDIDIPFATEWDELLSEELEAYSKHMLTEYPNLEQQKAAIFSDFLQIRIRRAEVKLPDDFFSKLSLEDLAISGLPLIEYLYGENKRTERPYTRLFENVLGVGVVYSTLSAFDSLTCGEFEDCEIFFHQFRDEPGAEPLAHLASILFRPRNVLYIRYHHRKGKYITYDAEKLYPKFLQLAPYQLYTIFIWYWGCRAMLPKLFPTAFEGDGSKGGEPDFLAFTKCIHSGAGPKNGSRDQIRCMLLKEFFLDMELEAQKAKELKKKYSNQ